jgi:predicted enzyme related to lactoylglutathione lyase
MKETTQNNPFEFIIYVADQVCSRNFYATVLNSQPLLDVPGMTEFELSAGCKLGIMPENGIARILQNRLPHPASGNGIPRCELYMLSADAPGLMNRLNEAGATLVSPMADRDWGHSVAYYADPDGHIIAVAREQVR